MKKGKSFYRPAPDCVQLLWVDREFTLVDLTDEIRAEIDKINPWFFASDADFEKWKADGFKYSPEIRGLTVP
jgi:hypothetical protein